MAVFALVYDFA